MDKLTIVVTAGDWQKRADGSESRIWDDGEDNAAARVVRKSRWPFASYEWAVWSPFDDEDAAYGTARSLTQAKIDADAALRDLIREVERGRDAA